MGDADNGKDAILTHCVSFPERPILPRPIRAQDLRCLEFKICVGIATLHYTRRYHGIARVFGQLTDRRCRYLNDITQRVEDERIRKQTSKDWEELASMCMAHFKSKAREYGGLTPGHRVVGRSPKMPIATAGSPHVKDFTPQNESHVTKARDLVTN